MRILKNVWVQSEHISLLIKIPKHFTRIRMTVKQFHWLISVEWMSHYSILATSQSKFSYPMTTTNAKYSEGADHVINCLICQKSPCLHHHHHKKHIDNNKNNSGQANVNQYKHKILSIFPFHQETKCYTQNILSIKYLICSKEFIDSLAFFRPLFWQIRLLCYIVCP